MPPKLKLYQAGAHATRVTFCEAEWKHVRVQSIRSLSVVSQHVQPAHMKRYGALPGAAPNGKLEQAQLVVSIGQNNASCGDK